MGKAQTTTEAMEHIASIVNEVTANIRSESNKLLHTINSIHTKTMTAIKESDQRILLWGQEIQWLEAKITSYEAKEDDETSYREQIRACQEQIQALRKLIRKERLRNNELRQTFSRFRQHSTQTLTTLKQTNLAADNANTYGKQYISKKTNILSTDYGKIVTGMTTLGAGLGLLSNRDGSASVVSSGDGPADRNSSEAQGAFAIQDFNTDMEAAQNWGEQAFRRWNDSLSIVERQAMIDYKKELYPHEASYYVNINNTLRGRGSFTDGNQMRYIRIHNALSRASVPSDITAYRAISREAYQGMITNARLAGNDGLRDNGFMSCSLISNNVFTNNNDVVLRLTVPAETRGAYIGNVGSDFSTECELLLDCGSTIFITNTTTAPRSTLTGNRRDTDTVTIVDGVVES